MLSLLGEGIVARVEGQGRTANKSNGCIVCAVFVRTIFVSSSRRLAWHFDRTSVHHVRSPFIHQLLAPAPVGGLCCGRPNVPTPGLPLIEQAPGRTPAVTSTVAGARIVGLSLIIGLPLVERLIYYSGRFLDSSTSLRNISLRGSGESTMICPGATSVTIASVGDAAHPTGCCFLWEFVGALSCMSAVEAVITIMSCSVEKRSSESLNQRHVLCFTDFINFLDKTM